jgi:Leucine-rich repeat (LRR) protein
MIILILIMTFFLTSCSDIFGQDPIYGCLDNEACNYNLNANTSDKTCTYLDSFQELGYCDCYENILDECGVCGGDGFDTDNDGICDDIDICIGVYSNGYYCEDVQVLQEFINGNTSIATLYVDDLYEEYWWNDYGRLEYLSLADSSLSYVPESIGNLDSLKTLFLNCNKLESIPNAICNLDPSCQIYIQNNNLAAEYNFECIFRFLPQEDCEDE